MNALNPSPITPEPLVEITDLTKAFGGRANLFSRAGPSVRAVDGVSLKIQRGETFGIVGETGSGKSTLGRLMLRLLDPTSGRIVFDGQDISHLSRRQMRPLRRDMQMVFQDPYGSLDPRMTVGAIVAEPMRVHGYNIRDMSAKIAEILNKVGLAPAMADRYPHEFSGGQRQRIGIARAIALDPKLLVLDEPVSALDVSVQAQILNLLRRIQSQSGVTFVFIAHDLAVVRHISDRIAVMYLGRIVELATRERLYAAPRHPYTASLLSAVPLPDVDAERKRKRITLYGEIGSATAVPKGCRFHPRCFKARLVAGQGAEPTTEIGEGVRVPRRCAEIDPALTPAGDGQQVACHFPLETDTVAGMPQADMAQEQGATHG